MSALPASTWGNPAASKHVLLLHGILSLGEALDPLGIAFAAQGYFVVAPDLLGHGRSKRSNDYSFAAYVDALRPFLAHADHRFHVIVGHSLGGIITTLLLPLLQSTRRISVVFVDPPFEQTDEELAHHRGLFSNIVRNPRSAEEYHEEEPHFAWEYAIFRSAAVRLCDIAAAENTPEQNKPWSFSRKAAEAPANTRVTVLAADPELSPPFVKEEYFSAYPHVNLKFIEGTTHAMPVERPDIIVEFAIKGLEE